MDILPQLLVNSLITGSIYALVAAGLALAYGLLRILNFAHGHLMMAGAYAFFYFHDRLGWPLALSLAATMIVACVLGLLTLTVFVVPFSRHNVILPLVSTIALSTILEAVVSLLFGVNVQSIDVGQVSSIEISGVYITPVQIVIIASAIVLLALLAVVVHCTSIGRVIRALRENPLAAQAIGVNKQAAERSVFVLGTCLAAYAGILIAIETNIQPTMGNSYSMKAFATLILGGLGNMWGTVAGAYILGLVENLSIGLDFFGYSLPAGYKDAFAYLIILVVLLLKPAGLFGRRSRAV